MAVQRHQHQRLEAPVMARQWWSTTTGRSVEGGAGVVVGNSDDDSLKRFLHH